MWYVVMFGVQKEMVSTWPTSRTGQANPQKDRSRDNRNNEDLTGCSRSCDLACMHASTPHESSCNSYTKISPSVPSSINCCYCWNAFCISFIIEAFLGTTMQLRQDAYSLIVW
jgi:hypothetical protein